MVLLAASFWGAMGILAREAYARGAEPLETVSARAALAFLALALLGARAPRRLAVAPERLVFYALFGAFGIALFYWLYFAALERVPVGIAAALLYTAPVFAVLLARLFLREPLTTPKVLALAAALVGLLLVTGVVSRGPGATFGGGSPLRDGAAGPEAGGVLLGLGAGFTYALFTLFGKSAGAREGPVRALFWAMGFGALILAVLEPPWRVLLDHPAAAPWILALALLSTFAANLLFIAGLRRVEAGTASVLATVEPVVAALLGWVWLGETLAASQLAGLGLVVGAAAALVGLTRPE